MFKNQTSQSNRLSWDVVLLMALYVILPTYCALEFSAAIPLITASRFLLMLVAFMLAVRNRRVLFSKGGSLLKRLNLGLTQDKFLRISLFLYFILLLITNLTFLFETSDALKRILTILIEEYALIWMLSLILDTRKKLTNAIAILVVASGITGLISSLGSVFDFNLFDYLNTVTRKVTQVSYYRLGLLRAAAGFGHPVYYGAFCAVMIPLCMYFVENAKNKLYAFLYSCCMVMNLLGLFFSNSRGSMLALVCIAVLIFLIRLFSKSLKQLFRTYLPILAGALAALVLLTALSPVGISFLSNTADSVIMSVLPTPSTEPTETVSTGSDTTDTPSSGSDTTPSEEPSDNVAYGDNVYGLNSRLVQLTGITYTLSNNPLFGMGPNAFARKLVGYLFTEEYSFINTVDINLVSIIGQFGLVGLAGFLCLYGSIGITALRKKYRGDPLMHFLFLSFACFMLCMLSISSLSKWLWIFSAFVVCLVNIINRETQAQA